MSLNDLTEKIKKDAQDVAESLINDAKKEADIIRRDFEILKEKQSRKFEDEFLRSIEKHESASESLARQEARMIRSSKKRILVERIITDAKKEVENNLEKWCEKILEKIVEEDKIHERVAIEVTPSCKSTVERVLGKQKNIDLREVIANENIKNGFIIMTKNHDYNYTVDSILAQKREELEIKIAYILFS